MNSQLLPPIASGALLAIVVMWFQRGSAVKKFVVTPNTYPVTDFIGWQRNGTLNLHPHFQRRSVWSTGAKSYFIDTIARGLPVPLIFLREQLDLEKQSTTHEVVDGQQRLRTIFAFIDEALLKDFDADRDRFLVKTIHNKELAGQTFKQLDRSVRDQLLTYRFSVQTLPTETENRDVLQIFARLNATGSKVNDQELRNAAWFGEFKTLMYELAYEQLERWQNWRVFTSDQLSRMAEVELVSDLVVNMIGGLSGKNQRALDRIYEKYDEALPYASEVKRRFRKTMDLIDETYGESVASGAFRRAMHFFTLFVYVYDRSFGLGSSMKRKTATSLPTRLSMRLGVADKRFSDAMLPPRVLKAVTGAATDFGKRKTRLRFLASICDGKTS